MEGGETTGLRRSRAPSENSIVIVFHCPSRSIQGSWGGGLLARGDEVSSLSTKGDVKGEGENSGAPRALGESP